MRLVMTPAYLTFNAHSGKITSDLKPKNATIYYTDILRDVVGYGGTDYITRITEEAPHVANITHFATIYVYCDIVQSQIVGDTSASLLRAVPVEG